MKGPATPVKVRVELVLANRQSAQDFARALGMVQAAAEDLPWRWDLTEAVELLAGAQFIIVHRGPDAVR